MEGGGCAAIGRGWKQRLDSILRSATEEVVVSSPYISQEGARFLATALRNPPKPSLQLSILTDLSAGSVAQGSNDPSAILLIAERIDRVQIRHLARVHAKVYVADAARAIVTSGNLTSGGLDRNYEYGVEISNPGVANTVRTDILDYAALGAWFDIAQLREYARRAKDVQKEFRKAQNSITRRARHLLDGSIRNLGDEVIRRQLAGRSINDVFSRTILYLLGRFGAMDTRALGTQVQRIHPDLCDDNVDRVIDGEHFGKKWKHQLRSAQSGLKRRGEIELRNGVWAPHGAEE